MGSNFGFKKGEGERKREIDMVYWNNLLIKMVCSLSEGAVAVCGTEHGHSSLYKMRECLTSCV